MSRRDWYIGVVLLALALLAHAAVPRYEWRHADGAIYNRVDRWTGHVEIFRVNWSYRSVELVAAQ